MGQKRGQSKGTLAKTSSPNKFLCFLHILPSVLYITTKLTMTNSAFPSSSHVTILLHTLLSKLSDKGVRLSPGGMEKSIVTWEEAWEKKSSLPVCFWFIRRKEIRGFFKWLMSVFWSKNSKPFTVWKSQFEIYGPICLHWKQFSATATFHYRNKNARLLHVCHR